MVPAHENKPLHPIRIIIAVIIGIILLAIAIALYHSSHAAKVSTQSTQQMHPNTRNNSPPSGINGSPMSSQ